MNNTKTIFKSLLIMIVAISLFTVSCSKDEGGTKNPTNPTPNSEALLTDILKGLGPLPNTGAAVIDFSKIMFDGQGVATIAEANKTYSKVKDTLTPVLTVNNFKNEKITLTADPTIPDNKPSTLTDPVSVELTFKANEGYTFDNSIIKGSKYAYTASSGTTVATAKLTLKITPEGGSWQ